MTATRTGDSYNRGRRPMAGVAALAAVLAVTGCATQLPEVPAISDSGSYLPGKVVWHDLVTPDLDGAKGYYGELFGWTFEDVNDDYTLVRSRGELIGGMAKLQSTKHNSYWIPLVSVGDVDAAVARTVSVGGERLVKPFEVPGRGRVGVLRDPQGATFAVVRAVQGDPKDRSPVANGWLWHEVWTDDVDAAGVFYCALFGYQDETREFRGTAYRFLSHGGEPRVGLLEKPDPEIGTTWVTYVMVDDVQATTEEVRVLGGTVLMAPRDDVRGGRVAIVADPHGAGLVVQEVEQ